MTDTEFKDLSDLIFEISCTLDKIEVAVSNSTPETLNHVWVIRGLNAVRKACASTIEDLESDLAEKQTPPWIMEEMERALKGYRAVKPNEKGKVNE